MAKLIIFLSKILYLYLYFILGVSVLSWIPDINPDYPLFHVLFKFAGFYILPPFMGMIYAPAIIMVVCALLLMGLEKIYNKYYKPKTPDIIIVSKDELMNKLSEQQNKTEENKDDSNKDN